jgi:hypothetical protein
MVGKVWLSEWCKFRMRTVQHRPMQLTFVENVSGRYFKKYQSDVFELLYYETLTQVAQKLLAKKYECLRRFL